MTGSPFLSIDFKNPVLKDKDASFLIGVPPRTVTRGQDADVWHYDFEAIRSTGPQGAPLEKLSLDLRVKDGKLLSIVVPETFLLYYSRAIVTESLHCAATADVLKLQKTIRAHIHLSPAADAELKNREQTLKLMGPPLEIVPDGGWTQFVYRYRIVDAKRDVPIIGRMSFDAAGRLHHAIISWDSSTVDVFYLRP
jgi:hypothetical protein